MGWLALGLILGGLYGFVWCLAIISDDGDEHDMPADVRRRDEWRAGHANYYNAREAWRRRISDD